MDLLKSGRHGYYIRDMTVVELEEYRLWLTGTYVDFKKIKLPAIITSNLTSITIG